MRIESVERERAWRGGYFWTSCPLCRKMYGGHEKGGGSLTWTQLGTGICVCPDCREEANRRSHAFHRVVGQAIYDGETHRFVKCENEDDPRLAFLKECNHGHADWPKEECFYCGKPWNECLDDIKARSDRILELAAEMEASECAS